MTLRSDSPALLTLPPAAPARAPAPVPRVGGAAEFRAWDRWARWTAHGRWRWRARVAAERALHPARAALGAWQGVRRYGAEVTAQPEAPSAARQLWQVWRLDVRYGLDANSYYRFQLFRPERAARAASYVNGQQYERVLRRYLDDAVPVEARRVLDDKRAFERWCAEHGLASVRTVCEFAPGGAPGAVPPDAFPPVDLFSKPADLAGGHGAARWRYAGDDRWLDAEGRAHDAAAVAEAAQRQATALRSPVLVQEAMRNHPDLDALSTGALCTARMVTVRPLGGDPRLALAIHRMPAGGGAVDNFGAGGLAAAVDLATGRLGPAMRKLPRRLTAVVERHPATGTAIAGWQLPHWREAVALAERAHRLSDPRLPVAGWDVAFTPRGPALVEGNKVPGINLMQMPLTTPLGESALVAHLLEYLDAAYRGGVRRA